MSAPMLDQHKLKRLMEDRILDKRIDHVLTIYERIRTITTEAANGHVDPPEPTPEPYTDTVAALFTLAVLLLEQN